MILKYLNSKITGLRNLLQKVVLFCNKNQAIHPQAGQALMEVCVCMVGIAVVLLGMLELSRIGMLQTSTMTEARSDVARIMQSDTVLFPTPDFLQTWEEGADGRRYTADDEAVTTSSDGFYHTTVEESVADPADWDILREAPSPLLTLHDTPAVPAAFFGLLKGEASATTDLLPGFQRLVYDDETITIESEVWMTWTKGIY